MRPAVAVILLLGAFYALWVTNAYLPVPLEALGAANIVATVVFVGLPIVVIAAMARIEWRPWAAILACLFCLGVVALLADASNPFVSGFVQIARFGWPAALGVLIAGMVRDRNLLLPIALVLATVDILAVFAPAGTVRQGLENPDIRPIFDALAYQVPTAGTAQPLAQMGPADPLFISMFLYAIRKFDMSFRATLWWMIPALAAYLGIVLLFGNRMLYGFSLGALPALVPVGIVVVLVNRKHFKPSRQEAAMTWGVAALCLAAIIALATVWRG